MVLDLETAQHRLHDLGITHPVHIASGMEGHVFRIDEERIAKTWFGKAVRDLLALQGFYEILEALHLPFETPRILGMESVEGTTISFERALPGKPMSIWLREDDEIIPAFAKTALTTILRGLGSAATTTALDPNIPMLGVSIADENVSGCQSSRLLNVANARVARHGPQLRASVPAFDWIVARTRQHLTALEPTDVRAIHGDLCPTNILLDDQRRVTAVLDWGFLSTFGDPAFDIAIAAGIFNMYGNSSRAMENELVETFGQEFGFSRKRLLLYRTLYAILTSNAYSPDGTDGHYAWCVATLRRNDVRAMLASSSVQ